MPAMMSVAEFLDEARDDFNSPTTSTFVRRMAQCRQTVFALEESLDFDRDGLSKMKKALKTIYNSGNAHVDNEVYLSKALERLGTNAMTKDQEPDIGAAFIKFSIVTKELSALMKTLMQNLNNVVMFPLDNVLKGDLKGVKGDLKKPFDKAWREYEGKLSKIEKEKKAQAKEVGMIRTEISPAEIAEELDKEKKWLQLQMCEYLLKANEIKTKKGVELLQHLVDYYHAQTSYFQDGLKTIEHFNGYINELSNKISKIKCKQDEERKKLLDLRTILKSSGGFGSDGVNSTLSSVLPSYHNSNYNSNSNTLSSRYNYDGSNDAFDGTSRKKESHKSGIYSLHQLQGNKNYGCFKSGVLLKKSEGKMRMKVWQKRKCEVKDGFLFISHSDDTKAPTKVNLLTCQVKYIPDEKKSFNLVSCNRTYHFQVEDENEIEAWISVLINSKEGALKKEFDSNYDVDIRTYSTGGVSTGIGTSIESRFSHNSPNLSLHELRQSILKYISKLPGNDKCVDCNSTSDATWLSTNFGVIVCIECSGIHRELGVHISRIQSLTLDNIGTSQLLLARVMSNHAFNDIMEATLRSTQKPNSNASMDARYEYIRAKYVDRKFVLRSCNGVVNDLKSDLVHAIQSKHIYSLLQVWAEGADLTWTLPNCNNGETALHHAIANEDGSSLHIVDFLVQNSAELLDKCSKDGNTPLHWAVEHNQSECMKLLLRSGANVRKSNSQGQTPLDLAKEAKHEHLIELIEHAMKNKKSLFENVNIEWNLGPGEDGSTDFSDDDLIDEKISYGNLVSSGAANTGGNGTVDKNNARSSSVLSNNESPMNRSSGSFKKRSDTKQQSIRRASASVLMNNNTSPSSNSQNISGNSGGNRSSFKIKSNSMTSPPKTQAQLQQQLNQQLAAAVCKLNTSGALHSKSNASTVTTGNTAEDGHSSGDSLGGGIYAHIRTPSDPAPAMPIYAQINSDRRGSGHWRASNILRGVTSTPVSSSSGNMSHSIPISNSMVVNTPLNGSLLDPSIHSHQTVHANSVKVVPTTTSKITSNTNGSTIIITGGQQQISSASQHPTLFNSPTSTSPLYSSLQRPRCPPPPLPPHQTKTTPLLRSTSNGQSHESIPSVSSVEIDSTGNPIESSMSSSISRSSHPSQSDHHLQIQATSIPVPVPPPRKYYFQKQDLAPIAGKIRRCHALYDCDADREDELSFKEGELILITSEKTEDEDWMEGFIESNPSRKGLFPASFVQIIHE